MAKIFAAFFNGLREINDKNAMPIFYEVFCKGLQHRGNDVFAVMHPYWSADFNNIPSHILQEIKTFDPDLIILFNNKFYDLSQEFDCPIVVYTVDSPLYFSNIDKLKKNPQRYTFLELQETSAQILKQDFKIPAKNIHIIPFFTEIRAQKKEIKRNICFIGTKFGGTAKYCIQKFMETHPTTNEREEYLKLMQKVKDNPLLSPDKLLEGIHSKKVKSYFNQVEIVSNISGCLRIQTLHAVEDLGLEIFGTPNWGNENYSLPYLNLRYNAEPIYSLAHNQEIYNTSKIGISIGHIQAKEGFPWRILDIMASNACLVTDYHESFKKYFPTLKLPCFEDQYEARDLCAKLLKDEAWRQDIVKQSQEIVDGNYRFENTLRIIEDILGMSLEGSKEGSLRIQQLGEWLAQNKPTTAPMAKIEGKSLSLKNKYCYKIWKHINKQIANKEEYKSSHIVKYKIWKHLSKKLRKKGIIK